MGFAASWGKLRRALEADGVIARGLTSHGLRHTLGARLREAGADDRTIADILGQRSASMARRYSENAALPDHARDPCFESQSHRKAEHRRPQSVYTRLKMCLPSLGPRAN